jgi:hypothetical protein
MDEILLKELLLAENDEFRRLFEEHRSHEAKLASFSAKTYLSSAEELEERELKKRKLALKDRMYLIMRDFRNPAP